MVDNFYGIGICCIFLMILAAPAAAAEFTGWEGTVTLDPATNVTVSGHEAWGDSALAALDAAAAAYGEYSYNASCGAWGHYLTDIGGIEGTWIFLVNGEQANLGIGNYRCLDGDLITLYNGTWGGAPDYASSPLSESNAVVNITTQIPYIPGPQPTGEYPMFHSCASRDGCVSGEGPETAGNVQEISLNGPAYASPVIDNGRVYITASMGDVYCINATTMAVEWHTPLDDGGGYSTAAVSGDRLYVGSYGGSLYALSLDGHVLWHKNLENDGQYWGLASSPLIYDGQVYVISRSDGTLHVFNPGGTEIWNVTTGHAIDDPVGYYASPSADNGRVFFQAYNGTDHALFCVDVTTRTKVWECPVDGPIMSMATTISDGTAYITTRTTLSAIACSDGTLQWSVPFGGNALCTPAVKGDSLYAGSSTALYCLSTVDGSEKWSFPANGEVKSSPVVTNSTVYFATNVAEGTVYAADAATGTEMWHHTLRPPEGKFYNIMSSPAIARGNLYIGGDDGKLHIFAPEGEGSFTGWEGTVTLNPGTNVTVSDHEAWGDSAFAALDAASKSGTFTYNASYGAWGHYLTDIGGIEGSWIFLVNGEQASLGIGNYRCTDGDLITLYNGTWGGAPDYAPSPLSESDAVVNITVLVPDLSVSLESGQSAPRGKWIQVNATFHTNTDGWYIVTASGINDKGESLAGTTTVRLSAGETLEDIPVLVAVPLQAETGTYTLRAGVYRLGDYPQNCISQSGGIECIVT